MSYASRDSQCRKLVTIAFAVAAIAVSACSANAGSGAIGGTGPFTDHAANKAASTVLAWATFVPVTPGPGSVVTGINNLAGTNGPEIVGFYTDKVATSSKSGRKTFSYSFLAKGPGYSSSTTTTASYPTVQNGTQPYHSLGTQINSIATQSSGLPIFAGWVSNPGNQCQIWPVVYNQGLWGLEDINYADQQTSAELFGINDENIAVGYAASGLTSKTSHVGGCQVITGTVASYFLTGGASYKIDLSKLDLTTDENTVANGIDDDGDMVGTYSKGATTTGWYATCPSKTICVTGGGSTTAKSFCVNSFTIDGSSNTTPYAIAGPFVISGGTQTDIIVGSYYDTAKGVTHGFLLPITKPSTGGCSAVTTGTYQDFHEPLAVNGTGIRGINNSGYIVGWYIDGNNKQDGFVGFPATGEARRSRPHRAK